MAIYNPNQKNEKKKGFAPFLSRMFGSTSNTSSGIGGSLVKGGFSLGKSGFFGSLFSTKAGFVGLLLGAATIAAGVGLVYNYLGTSSQSIYTPALFSDGYYEEAQRQANAERVSNQAQNAESSLFKFAEVAQKEFGVSKNANERKQNNDEEINLNQSASSDTNLPEPANSTASAQENQNPGKLHANLGFNNNQGGGSSSSVASPKLQTSGGLWSNLGKQFSPLVSSQAKMQASGKTSNMNRQLSARLVASPKYHVPNVNKKGAFGQAKFAGNVGKAAAYHVSDAGARTTAEQAFSGETGGSGDIATPIGGTGLGGAGLSQGNKLKANDPALNMSEYTPPPTPNKSTDTPWKKLTDYALYSMLAAAAFIGIASLFAQKAKTAAASVLTAPSAPAWFAAAKAFAMLAIAAALVVIGVAIQLAGKYGQKMMGIMYGVIGGLLIIQAIRSLIEIHNAQKEAELKINQAKNFYNDAFSKMNENQKAAFKKLTPEQQWKQVDVYIKNPTEYTGSIDKNLGIQSPSVTHTSK